MRARILELPNDGKTIQEHWYLAWFVYSTLFNTLLSLQPQISTAGAGESREDKVCTEVKLCWVHNKITLVALGGLLGIFPPPHALAHDITPCCPRSNKRVNRVVLIFFFLYFITLGKNVEKKAIVKIQNMTFLAGIFWKLAYAHTQTLEQNDGKVTPMFRYKNNCFGTNRLPLLLEYTPFAPLQEL